MSANELVQEILLEWVLPIVGIITLISVFFASRRVSKTYKKMDYLVEDLTYKSELLNSTVESIDKASKYFDTLDALMKKNSKSFAKVLVKNKEFFYKAMERMKEIAQEEKKKQEENVKVVKITKPSQNKTKEIKKTKEVSKTNKTKEMNKNSTKKTQTVKKGE